MIRTKTRSNAFDFTENEEPLNERDQLLKPILLSFSGFYRNFSNYYVPFDQLNKSEIRRRILGFASTVAEGTLTEPLIKHLSMRLTPEDCAKLHQVCKPSLLN